PQFKSRLPGAGVTALLNGPAGLIKELELDPTLLFIDAETKTATITFSGSFLLLGDDWLETHHIDTELFYCEEEDVVGTVRKPEEFDATQTLEEVEPGDAELPFVAADRSPRLDPVSFEPRLPTGTIHESDNLQVPVSLPFRSASQRGYRRIEVDDVPEAVPAAPSEDFNQTLEVSADILSGKPFALDAATPFDEGRPAIAPERIPLDQSLLGTGTIEMEPSATGTIDVEPTATGAIDIEPPAMGALDMDPSATGTIEMDLSMVMRGELPFQEPTISKMKSDPPPALQPPPEPGDPPGPEDSSDPLLRTIDVLSSSVVRGLQALPFASEESPSSGVHLKRGGPGESFMRLVGNAELPRPKQRKQRTRRRRARSA
ncbi:hypothetical protein JYT28_01185, partial [Desulfobulbus sp. AH-315-M07]|nr:hypothetical protein [Desulfobulbus sp. AH-315-M07]